MASASFTCPRTSGPWFCFRWWCLISGVFCGWGQFGRNRGGAKGAALTIGVGHQQLVASDCLYNGICSHMVWAASSRPLCFRDGSRLAPRLWASCQQRKRKPWFIPGFIASICPKLPVSSECAMHQNGIKCSNKAFVLYAGDCWL